MRRSGQRNSGARLRTRLVLWQSQVAERARKSPRWLANGVEHFRASGSSCGGAPKAVDARAQTPALTINRSDGRAGPLLGPVELTCLTLLRFMKILVANRGEIAVRIIRACREMGIPTVAVYSDCDRMRGTCARRTRRSTSARARPRRATCGSTRILDAAKRAGADAVHPGYGFLAENAAFAQRLPRRGTDVHRPVARSDRADGQQDGGARRRDRGRRAGRARNRDAPRRAT